MFLDLGSSNWKFLDMKWSAFPQGWLLLRLLHSRNFQLHFWVSRKQQGALIIHLKFSTSWFLFEGLCRIHHILHGVAIHQPVPGAGQQRLLVAADGHHRGHPSLPRHLAPRQTGRHCQRWQAVQGCQSYGDQGRSKVQACPFLCTVPNVLSPKMVNSAQLSRPSFWEVYHKSVCFSFFWSIHRCPG